MAVVLVEDALNTDCNGAQLAKVLDGLVVVARAEDVVVVLADRSGSFVHGRILDQTQDLVVFNKLVGLEFGDSTPTLVVRTGGFRLREEAAEALFAEGMTAVREDDGLSVHLIEPFLAAFASKNEIHFGLKLLNTK